MRTLNELDETYVNWLYRSIEGEGRANYWKLMLALYQTRFEYYVAFDENRAIDGVNLRREFLFEMMYKSEVSAEWVQEDCSMLEMIIAISHRMAFQLDFRTERVFWRLINNINLMSETDEYFDEEHVFDVLEVVNKRLYNELGHGGLFPLHESAKDQRNVELIYQMHEYIGEYYK